MLFFCCLPAPQADLTRFRRVIVWWVSTAKRKTRLHTDFRSARRSKRINPLKITLPTQFLRKIEEEMLKIHVSSLATQFGPQRLRYETFISRYASLATSNIASSNVNGTLSRFAQYFGRLLCPRPGVPSNGLTTRKPKCFPGTLVIYISVICCVYDSFLIKATEETYCTYPSKVCFIFASVPEKCSMQKR